MSPSAMLVPTILFWVLAVTAVCVPPRYGVLILILVVQFDLTGIAFFSDASLGVQNAIKVVLIPTVILLRMRPIDFLPSAFKWVRNYWLALTGYAAVAIAWSPYRLSSVKLIGYFYAYSAFFVIFTCAWRRRWFTRTYLIFIVTVSLLLAVTQTYFLGNLYGNPEYENRFTTFSDAQSFAPFLICMIILLVICNRRTVGSVIAVTTAVLGLVLTGSRSNLIGFVWVALIIGIALAKQTHKQVHLSVLIRNAVIGCLVVVMLGVLILNAMPRSRLTELLEVVTSYDNHSLESVGTFAWRLTVYAEAVKELSDRSWQELAMGSGTSSGALVGLQTGFFQESNVDPNRVIHDEFLRALYEWGVFGLAAFVCFLGTLFRLGMRMIKLTSSPYAWACLAVFGPLLASLLIENVFADGASPGGVGYCLIFASMAGQLRPATAKARALVQPEFLGSEARG